MSFINTKTLNLEITHLSCDQNKQLLSSNKSRKSTENEEKKDIIQRLMKSHLRRTLEEEAEEISIESIKLEDKSPDRRFYYEEKEVYRMSASITLMTTSRNNLKKTFTKISTNQIFSNTLFGLIDHKSNTLKYLSTNDKIEPRIRIKKIFSFGFGSFVDLTNFVEHYSSNGDNGSLNVAKDDIIADFKSDEKSFDLIFRLTSGGNNGKYTKNIRYKLECEYKAINSITFSLDSDGKSMKTYLTLSHPPLLFKVAFDDMSDNEKLEYWRKNPLYYDSRKPRHKQKLFKTIENENGVHTNEILSNEIWIRDNEFSGCHKEIIGKSNVLLIEISLIQNETKSKIEGQDSYDPFRLLLLMRRFTKIPIYFGFINRYDCPPTKWLSDKLKEFSKRLNRLKDIKELNVTSKDLFPIGYAFNSLFSFNFFPSDEMFFKTKIEEFIEKVIEFSKTDINAIEETLFELSKLIDRNVIFISVNALNSIFNDFCERNIKCKSEDVNIKSFNTEIEYIRRCILTPTRFLMLPPQPTLRSRFIVNSEPEYTIRLSIREDDLQSLQFSVGNSKMDTNSILRKMIEEPLLEGIIIGDRNFEFLGSSTSQLRDTGLILYAKDSMGRDAEKIRESIGDMSHISNNVAKYVARLGLAFSQVMTHIDVPKSQTQVIEDIEREDEEKERKDPYNFSDGIGKVSEDIMERVYEKLKIECKQRPCAMQIRYGGCKGMLVVDPTLKGEKKIIFRKSMVKYESDAQILGIIKLSAPRPLYLNRPLITILDQLGIKDNIFLQMLLDDLKLLSNSMVCECSATKLLQSSSTLGIPYRKLFKSEVPFLNEPLFRQIIDSVINHRINELKLKARIKVPMNSGRTVFGVLDETGTLEYGQVFVQLSHVDEDNMPIDSTFILEQEIMITKFPCLHPGDVRKFQAIDVKALHHIKDCVVFPQKGRRPHPNEMAGSDLDGDEYAVVWNSPLIFEQPNETPMDFPESQPNLLDHKCTVKDILDFYCNYIVGNNVGLLANAHLARADTERDGIFSDVCMSLARKYAIALDFPKTGIIENIDWTEKPFIYPDFMEKFAKKRTQLSRRILGQLYRHCDRIGLGMVSNKNLEITAKPNERFKIDGWEEFKDSAIQRYKDYQRNVENLLNRFGVENEAQLLSGTFSRTSKYMSGRNETNDVHELLESFINKVFIHFKELFNSDSESDTELERSQRASAWYMAPFQVEGEIKDRYFGFSWTISEQLCLLFQTNSKKTDIETNGEHNCIQFVAKVFDDFFANKNLYREPEFDESIDLNEKRKAIVEKRFITVRIVLRAWLERQDHLFFKRMVKKKMISSTDYVISDMDRKMTSKLDQLEKKAIEKALKSGEPLESAGFLVINFLKQSVKEWFSVETLDLNNRVVDTSLIKLGFSAFITLNHYFKTLEISHIIHLGKRFKVSLMAQIRDEVFFLPLPVFKKFEKNEESKWIGEKEKYTEFMAQTPEIFLDNLKKLCGVFEVYLEPYAMHTKRTQHYYLLTVTGTVWSIQSAKNFICHPSFFKIVPNQKWRKRNLFYKQQFEAMEASQQSRAFN